MRQLHSSQSIIPSKAMAKKMSKAYGVRNFNAETGIGTNEQTQIKRPFRRPHIAGTFERRHSQQSLGNELVLSKVSTLKMVWSMETKQ